MILNREIRLKALGLYSGPNTSSTNQLKLPVSKGNGGSSGGWRLRPDLVYKKGKPTTVRFGSSRGTSTGTRKRFFF